MNDDAREICRLLVDKLAYLYLHGHVNEHQVAVLREAMHEWRDRREGKAA